MKNLEQITKVFGKARMDSEINAGFAVKIKRYGYRVFIQNTNNGLLIFKFNGRKELTDTDFLLNDYLFDFKEMINKFISLIPISEKIEHIFTIDFLNSRTYYDATKYPEKFEQDINIVNLVAGFGVLIDDYIHIKNVDIFNEPEMRKHTGTEGSLDYFIVKTKELEFKIHDKPVYKEPDVRYTLILNQMLDAINEDAIIKFEPIEFNKEVYYIKICEQILKSFLFNNKMHAGNGMSVTLEGGLNKTGEFYRALLSQDVSDIIDENENVLSFLKIIIISFKKDELKHDKYVSEPHMIKFKKIKSIIDRKLEEFDPLQIQIPTYKQWAYQNRLQENRLKQ